MRRTVCFLSVLLLLVSCASLSKPGTPEWVASPPRMIGSAVFVGSGDGKTREEAKANAYDDVLSSVSEVLGWDISSLYLREMISKGRIESLSVTVEDEHYSHTGDSWTYYVLAAVPNRAVRDQRSPEYLALLEREDRIKAKLDESTALYSENMDIAAVDSIIDAIEISLEGNVNNPEYSPEALRDKASGYIRRIRITAEKAKARNGEVTVRVRRSKGLFNPSVSDGYICSMYYAVTSEGSVVSKQFISKTDRSGRFFFNRTDPYMLRSSSYKFFPYIDQAKLSRIEDKAGSAFTAPLISAADEASLIYSYTEKDRISSESYASAVSVFDISGNRLPLSLVMEPMKEQLSKAGLFGFEASEGIGETGEDDYELLRRLYPDAEYYFILRTGTVDYIEGADKAYVRTDAAFEMYGRDGEIIRSQNYYTLGDGSTFDEAMEESFSRLSRLTSGFLLSEL